MESARISPRHASEPGVRIPLLRDRGKAVWHLVHTNHCSLRCTCINDFLLLMLWACISEGGLNCIVVWGWSLKVKGVGLFLAAPKSEVQIQSPWEWGGCGRLVVTGLCLYTIKLQYTKRSLFRLIIFFFLSRKKNIILPVLCGVFLVHSWFKITPQSEALWRTGWRSCCLRPTCNVPK